MPEPAQEPPEAGDLKPFSSERALNCQWLIAYTVKGSGPIVWKLVPGDAATILQGGADGK